MRTRLNVRGSKENQRFPMHNVYTEAIRCLITYVLVASILLVSPTGGVMRVLAATTNETIDEATTVTENANNEPKDIIKDAKLFSQESLPLRNALMEVTQKNIERQQQEHKERIRQLREELEKERQQEELKRKKEEARKKELARKAKKAKNYHYGKTYGRNSSIKGSSGLTATQIDGLLKGTKLHGIGNAVHYIEKEYGINAYFTISVASLESGYGKSGFARINKNIFGIMGKSFSSFSECVRYFGRLMHTYENKHKITMTPAGINKRYCELSNWSGKVVNLMNGYIKKANNMY